MEAMLGVLAWAALVLVFLIVAVLVASIIVSFWSLFALVKEEVSKQYAARFHDRKPRE